MAAVDIRNKPECLNGGTTGQVLSKISDADYDLTWVAQSGGLPTTTGSIPANITGMVVAGASPSGTVKVQLASETAGTTVTIKAGSFLKYRTY